MTKYKWFYTRHKDWSQKVRQKMHHPNAPRFKH